MEKVNINLLVGLDTKVKLDYLNTNFKAAKVFNIKDYGKGKSSKHNLEVALATYLNKEADNKEQAIVYYAKNLNRKKRMKFYKKFKDRAKITIHFFALDFKTCLKTALKEYKNENKARKALLKQYKNLQVPRLNVDCDAIKVIGDFEKYKPEFAEDISHDSPYHHESLHTHNKLAIELAKEDKDPARMQEIATFHDLGKHMARIKDETDTPAANYFRSVNNGKFYHYSKHQYISACYYLAYINEKVDLNQVNNPQVQEKLENLEVIYQHMHAHQGFSKKMIKRYKLNETELALLNRFEKIDSAARVIDEEVLSKFLSLKQQN